MAIYYTVLYNAIICIYPTSPYWKRSILSVHWKDWCWSWNSNTLATSCIELTHCKRPWCWEGLGAWEEGDDRGWDGWMASPTWWTWVWVGDRQGGLACCDSWGHRVRHDWVTELNWNNRKIKPSPLCTIPEYNLVRCLNLYFKELYMGPYTNYIER